MSESSTEATQAPSAAPIRVRLNAKGISRKMRNRGTDSVGVVIGVVVQWEGETYWDVIDIDELVKVT